MTKHRILTTRAEVAEPEKKVHRYAVILVKIFLYDLAALSSATRAVSFLAVGGALLLGGFFYQRLTSDA